MNKAFNLLVGMHNSFANSYNKVWNAYQYTRGWWEEKGVQREIINDSFLLCWNTAAELFQQYESDIHKNQTDIKRLNNIGEDLIQLSQCYINSAKQLYTYESCWNPRLPHDITKVLGHDYTCTEFIRQQTQMCGESLNSFGNDFKNLK